MDKKINPVSEKLLHYSPDKRVEDGIIQILFWFLVITMQTSLDIDSLAVINYTQDTVVFILLIV